MMARHNDNLQHFGPEPHHGSGPQMVHYMVHERAFGKTIAAVYLGDSKRFRAEGAPPDGIYRSEYLAFEFTDGSVLELSIGSGNTFVVQDGSDLKRAKRSRKKIR